MKSNPMVSLSTCTVRRQDIIETAFCGGMAMLDLETGRYHVLNPTASRIWDMLEGPQPREVNQLCDALVREFEVERDKCEQEVLGLLQELVRERLVHVISCEP